jgi:hypothetical protein
VVGEILVVSDSGGGNGGGEGGLDAAFMGVLGGGEG